MNSLSHAMKQTITLVLVLFFAGGFSSLGAETSGKMVPVLKINQELDKRTVIKPSIIPGAGNGLFAVVAIKKGEVIGELGGRLVRDEDYPVGNHYLASIPKCAWEETKPYKYLDSKDYGGHVSRTNFAPSKINGIDTNFQNAEMGQLCKYPYFVFIALKDIAPRTEIWSSYGPHYDYDKFMYEPAVRDFFCGRLKIDCRKEYTFEP